MKGILARLLCVIIMISAGFWIVPYFYGSAQEIEECKDTLVEVMKNGIESINNEKYEFTYTLSEGYKLSLKDRFIVVRGYFGPDNSILVTNVASFTSAIFVYILLCILILMLLFMFCTLLDLYQSLI